MPTFYGTPHNRTLEVISGTNGDDYFFPLGGWDVLQGGGGFDTVYIVGKMADFRVVNDGGVTSVNALTGASKGTESATLYDMERLVFSDGTLDLTAPQTYYAEPGSRTYIGNAGVDRIVYAGSRSQFSIEKAGDYFLVTDLVGNGGIDRIRNIERLVFSDGKLALDMASSARDAARLVGTLLGPASVKGSTDAERLIGVVLELLDSGQSLTQIAQSALAALCWDTRVVAQQLYVNVLGRSGSPKEIDALMSAVQGQTAAEVTKLACDLGLADVRIGLVGLADTGLPYI